MANYSSEYTFRAVDQITPFIRKIKGQMDGLKQQMRSMSQRVKLNVDSRQAQTNIKRLSQQFYQFARKPKVLGVDTKAAHTQIQQLSAHYANSMRAAQVQMLPSSMKQKPLAQAVPSAAKAAAGGAAGGSMGMKSLLAGFGGYMAVGSALDLGKAETELKKFTGATGPELENLKKQAFDLESEAGYAAASIMGMMSEASKAGVANNNLKEDALFSTKTGIAFDMSAAEAAESITHLRGSFFSGQDYATQQVGLQKMANMISYVADNSASSEKYLVNFMQRASGLVHVMGVTKESLASAGGAFEAIGIAPEVAARSVNSFQDSMAKLAFDKKSLAELGFDQAEFKKMVSEDLFGTVFKVVAKANELGKLESIGALKGILGQFGDEAIRLNAALPIYTANIALANDETKHAAAFADAYKIQMEGLNASWNRAKEGMKTVLGIAITPYLKAASDAVANLMEFAKQHPTLTKLAVAMMFMATASKAYSVVGGFASGSLKAFMKSTAKSNLAMAVGIRTATMFGGRLAGLAPGVSMLTHAGEKLATPFNVAALKIGLFAGAAYLAYNNSSYFRGQLSMLGDTLLDITSDLGIATDSSELFMAVGTYMGAAFGSLVLILRELILVVQGAGRVLAAFFSEGDFTSLDGLEVKLQAIKKEAGEVGQEMSNMALEAAQKQNASFAELDKFKAENALKKMQGGANAVQATKAEAGLATGIPTTASPQSIEQAKAAVAQQKVAADTSKAAAETNKLAADTSKAGADSFKSGVDRFSVIVGRMESSINNLSNIKINVGVAGAAGGLNLGSQGR